MKLFEKETIAGKVALHELCGGLDSVSLAYPIHWGYQAGYRAKRAEERDIAIMRRLMHKSLKERQSP